MRIANASVEIGTSSRITAVNVTAVLFGQSLTLPVLDGALSLGTWQSLFLMEIDGPRARRLDMVFLGD